MGTGKGGERGKNSAMGKKMWTSVWLTVVELGKERKRRWWMAWDGLGWLFRYEASFWGFIFWAKCAWGRVRTTGRVCVFVCICVCVYMCAEKGAKELDREISNLLA